MGPRKTIMWVLGRFLSALVELGKPLYNRSSSSLCACWMEGDASYLNKWADFTLLTTTHYVNISGGGGGGSEVRQDRACNGGFPRAEPAPTPGKFSKKCKNQ